MKVRESVHESRGLILAKIEKVFAKFTFRAGLAAYTPARGRLAVRHTNA